MKEREKERGRKKCYFSTDEIFLLPGTKQTDGRENKTEKLSNQNFISPNLEHERNSFGIVKKTQNITQPEKKGGRASRSAKTFVNYEKGRLEKDSTNVHTYTQREIALTRVTEAE